MSDGAYLIANPKAGKGRLGDRWEEILRRLHEAGLEPVGDLTQRPGHAADLARAARREGRRLVVACGGDGTVHEVVNGLLARGPGPDMPALGIISLGSGCDYAKTFDIPAELDAAVRRLAAPDPPREVDAGELRFSTAGGGGVRYFANIAEAGIGPEVVQRAARLPRALGAAVYFAAFWLTLPGFRKRDALLKIDGEVAYQGSLTNLVVAIGRVFGGGMHVAPEADPTDGLFDVQVHRGSKLDYVVTIPKVFRGTHLPHPKIDEARGAEVVLTCEPAAVVEADGEVLGTTPATYRVLPRALRIKA